MDQKRLMLAIALSIGILLTFQMLMPQTPRPAIDAATSATATAGAPAAPAGTPGPRAAAAPAGAGTVPKDVPRLKIAAARLQGSVSLLGGRIDDLVLRGYRETIEKNAPLVRLLEPRSDAHPYYIQFGWSAAEGTTAKLPADDTVWTGSGEIGTGTTGQLAWDNGEGLRFEIEIGIDANYMFTIRQRVINSGATPVALYPWSRIRRDYTPEVAGYYILHEGMLGVLGGTLKETTYSGAKSDGEKKGGIALEQTGAGGWIGITDKYWLTAIVPDQAKTMVATFRHINQGGDRYQADFVAKEATIVAPGATADLASRVFAGAKEVHLLDGYEASGIPNFDKAVDFGWFYFITKPIFYALDWLNTFLGNFGLAILVLTVFIKALFYPLANKSYRSMSKMKLLGPKITELRERLKDEPQKMQQEMLQLYKAEKVNPASGCLPILVQVPVFFSLYKVIFVTIEMRQAPFYGWVHDLSAIDPTNVFNLFGLLPFDPGVYSSFLHLGVWPIIMGITMHLQMKLNPPPPDPVQAKVFAFMPLLFTFMLASFPAGLVIYWSWNNLLTIAQQWNIMRQTSLEKPSYKKSGA